MNSRQTYQEAKSQASPASQAFRNWIILPALFLCLVACQQIERVGDEFKGGRSGIVWYKSPGQLKDPSAKKANSVYVSIRDASGEDLDQGLQRLVKAALTDRGYTVTRDPEDCDFKLKVILRNLYEGVPADAVYATKLKESEQVAYSLTLDVIFAERVAEAVTRTEEVVSGDALSESIFDGSRSGSSTVATTTRWVRDNKEFFAVYANYATVWNKGKGVFSGRASSLKNMQERLASALPALFATTN